MRISDGNLLIMNVKNGVKIIEVQLKSSKEKKKIKGVKSIMIVNYSLFE